MRLGRRLGVDVGDVRIGVAQSDPEGLTVVEWSTWRLEDASWIIRIQYPGREGLGLADWNFDLTKRALTALNDNARWIVGEDNSPQRTADHGLVYNAAPEPQRRSDAPRLVAIRENPDVVSAKDGVSGRAKVPSWDEIMFGSSKQKDADPLD